MKKAVVKFTGVSPYSQSLYINEPKLAKETASDYENRNWRKRLHTDETGGVYIPPMAFKNCLSDAAKYLSIQIPGKGKSTYTKHFAAGVLVIDPIPLGIQAADVAGETLHVPSDGKPGGGSRVLKTFPKIIKWGGTATFYILDETITKDVFFDHLKQAGQFIGVGRFRPRNGGFYGRFRIDSLDWMDAE